MSDTRGLGSLARAVWRPEVLRTCNACGYAWKVPGYYAKMRVRGRGSYRTTNVYGQAFSTSRSNNMVNGNAAMAESVASYRTCDRCQSQDYTQKRLWRETDADFEGKDD